MQDVAQSCAVKKFHRGLYEYVSSDNGTVIARWDDNSTVTVASTLHTVFSVDAAKCYSKVGNKQTAIPLSLLIGEYSEFTGERDLTDENINRYKIGICGKKWRWPVFTWLLEVSIQNA